MTPGGDRRLQGSRERCAGTVQTSGRRRSHARTIRPPPTRLGRIVRAAARGGFARAGRRSQTPRRSDQADARSRGEGDACNASPPPAPPLRPSLGESGPGLAPRPEPDRRSGGRDRAQPPQAASQVSAGPQGCKLTRRRSERQRPKPEGWRASTPARPLWGPRRIDANVGPERGRVEGRAQRSLVHTSWEP